jgi:hypothetical protein
MDPTFQVTPEAAPALAVRLFTKEQFAANPRACILAGLDWLDRATGDDNASAGTEHAVSKRHPLVEELAVYITSYGFSYDMIGDKIGVSSTAIGGWLRGTSPKAGSLEKIRVFLQKANASGRETPLAPDASGPAQTAKEEKS